jgi:sulfate adenylyltransferase subunit 1
MIAKPNNQPKVSQDIDLMICWLNEKGLIPGGKYTIKHTTKEARCIIKEIQYTVDINTLHKNEENKTIGLNDIGRIRIRTTKPLYYDSYKTNRYTGSVILIEESTNETVGAGMII